MAPPRTLTPLHNMWIKGVENTQNLWRQPPVLWSKLWDQKNVEHSSTNPLRGPERRA